MSHHVLRKSCSKVLLSTLILVLSALVLRVSVAADDSEQAQGNVAVHDEATPQEKTPLFETDVQPILQAKCVKCHSAQSKKAELDLSTMAGVREGSESGEILVAGDLEESLLYEMVHEGMMPPEEEEPLSDEQVAVIRRWIEAGAPAAAKKSADTTPEVNQHDIIPIINVRCVVCHGGRKQEAGLDLRTKASMLKGGKSGPAIVLGKPEESLLLKRIHADEMPPPKLLVDFGVRPIGESEVETLKKWIELGAPEVVIQPDIATTEPDPLVTDEDRKYWAFQPPKQAPVPEPTAKDRVRNPIDAFILRRLEEQGLTLSPEADRRTLIRRVAFDLTGLPPAPQEVQEFLADTDQRAYERMVDRYLASPRYGERYARHWLDLVGYADSEGKRSQDSIRPHAWRYRDYVVRSLNADKPYDRFLLEGIAGDELADYEDAAVITQELMDNLIATGLLRMAPDGTGSDIVNTIVERLEVVTDQINIFGEVVLGITLKCAQCHSHKYDPIPQRDYYRMVDTFKGAYDEHDWLRPTLAGNQTKSTKEGRVLPYVTPEVSEAWKKHNAQYQQQIDVHQTELDQKTAALKTKHFEDRLAKLPEVLREDLRKTFDTPAEKRTEVQKYLAEKFDNELRLDVGKLKELDAGFKEQATALQREIGTLKGKLWPEPKIRALWDRGNPSPTYIYRRGDFTNPGRLVGPGVLSVMTDGRTPFELKPPWTGSKKTGRRLALAQWVIAPEHPLTARVQVNRAWRRHFGVGIVKSTSNFGHTGIPPTHPELLDWLAVEFMQQGWSMKALHRLMLASSTYRQVSEVTELHLQLDEENKLLSRMPLRRMDAEVLRDTIMSVAGKLDETRFGPPEGVKSRADGLVTSMATEKGWRRTLYVLQRRTTIPTILENFDLPQMIPNCIERPHSTVASQALHLMNNGMIRRLADTFAQRVQQEVGSNPLDQIDRVYWLAFSRPPTYQEQELSRQTLAQLTQFWQQQSTDESTTASPSPSSRALGKFCHTMLNSAAFLYID